MNSLSQDLLAWYHAQRRDLPWRRTKDPYAIWISEVMLQQTTVAAVIPYWEKWMQRFPAIEDVAHADEVELLNLWQGLGYYNRVRNVHKAARVIVRDLDGVFPETPEAVRALPGFGPYTTAAVLSIAFNQPLPLIDANVRRVGMRLLAIEGLATTQQDPVLYPFFEEQLPFDEPGDFNQALMELGARICKPKEPPCLLCPIKAHCHAYAAGLQEIIPTPKSLKITRLAAALAVIYNERGEVYLQKRPEEGLLAGMWEFPGGKQEEGESIEETLHREIHEELGVTLRDVKFFCQEKHAYTRFQVTLHVFECASDDVLPEDETHQWVSLQELENFPMPSGSAKIVARILAPLGA